MPIGVFSGCELNKSTYCQIHPKQKKNPQPNRNMLATVIKNCFHGTDFTIYTIYLNLSNHDSGSCELPNFIFLRVLKPDCIFKKPYGTDEPFHFAIIPQCSGKIISI